MSPAAASPAVSDELRQLFDRGDYDALLIRTDNLERRKRLDDVATRQFVHLLRALSLIHLGRPAESVPLLKHIPDTAAAPVRRAALYARLYAAWASNEGIDDALADADAVAGEHASRLKAQLLYRCGRYSDAADLYVGLFRDAKATLDAKKRPAATSRWRIMSREPAAAPVTAAELEQHAAVVNELATNAMAALVLAARPAEAEQLKAGLRASYELEYNAACAQLSAGGTADAASRTADAEISLQSADALVRAELDDDDDDNVDEAVAPVTVQLAYVRHLAGAVEEAASVYARTVEERKADAASLAVAANNLTVALGQLAFRGAAASTTTARVGGGDGDGTGASANDTRAGLLPKEQHDALVEGLKKMRATSGKAVERKLTVHQRRAMARNRAILLVQMGRLDACRAELARLKADFPGDALVPLIEASLVARHAGPETADKVLALAGDSDAVRAARAQLAAAHGDKARAAALLGEFFPKRPAAGVTAATLLEESGDVDAALARLRGLVDDAPTPADKRAARKALAAALLRLRRFEQAAELLRQVTRDDPADVVATAQLVVAASHFDADEAAAVAARLPDSQAAGTGGSAVDAAALEAQPPPRRKQVVALKGGTSAAGNASATPSAAAAAAAATAADAADTKSAPVRDADDAAARAAAARERKKKKKKKRLPKNYDPNGPPPDPERWLPKTLRAGYKKKKAKTENAFRGSQGADAAAAEVAAAKNAERSAAKAAAAATAGPSAPPGARAKAQRKKKNRR